MTPLSFSYLIALSFPTNFTLQSLTCSTLVQSFITDPKTRKKDKNKLVLDILTQEWEKKPLRDELYI